MKLKDRIRLGTLIKIKNEKFPDFAHLHLDVENDESRSIQYCQKVESRMFGKLDFKYVSSNLAK